MADTKSGLDKEVTRRLFLVLFGIAIIFLLGITQFMDTSAVNSAKTASSTVAGPIGVTGAAGPKGLDGALGATGIEGVSGPRGATGATGPRGATGATGAQAASFYTGSPITYYMNVADLADSFIEIPTSTVSISSTTLSASDLAGTAPIYDTDNIKVGEVSSTFLSIQNADGIYTDISNNLSSDNGLVANWSTPSTPIDLALDSIINSMATESTVTVNTKLGATTYYGKTFDLVVSSNGGKIYFQFNPIN